MEVLQEGRELWSEGEGSEAPDCPPNSSGAACRLPAELSGVGLQ